MDTMHIQLTYQKAIQLLYQPEELHLIKGLKKSIIPNVRLSEKYAGSLNLNLRF